MRAKRRVLEYGLATLLLVVPGLILTSSLKEPENLNRFDDAVLRVASPLQGVADWVVSGLGGVWNRYVWLVDVDEENEELRAENKRLHHELARANRLVGDTGLLEDLLQLRQQTAAETVGARVVSASLNPHFRVVRLRLDHGDRNVEPRMPVIDANGLVGRIQNVYGDYSDVLLTTDPESSVDVIVARTGSRGVLTGLAREDAYRAKIEYLEQGKEVKEGDLVVTSGLGSAFPRGIPVGTIVFVRSEEGGLYQEVEVSPAVDFSRLTSVLVVLAPPPPPDPNAGNRRRSEPAYRNRPH